MAIWQIQSDNRGVSPVIGVILMVAITVILAAVIGTFVLGLGDSIKSAPTASFSWDESGSTLTVTHEGGDAIATDELSVVGAPVDANATVSWSANPAGAGASADVTLVDGESGQVRLVWTNPDGGDTAVISTHTVE